LELFLEELPPTEMNISKAHTGLTEAKWYLLSSANNYGKTAGRIFDGNPLLGKLHYAIATFEFSLNYYN